MVLEKLRKPVKIKHGKGGKIKSIMFRKKSHFTPDAEDHIRALSADSYLAIPTGMEDLFSVPIPRNPGELAEKTKGMSRLLREQGASAILSDLSSIPAADLKELDESLRSGEWEFELSMLGHYVLKRKP